MGNRKVATSHGRMGLSSESRRTKSAQSAPSFDGGLAGKTNGAIFAV
jgi:hypothetical protein